MTPTPVCGVIVFIIYFAFIQKIILKLYAHRRYVFYFTTSFCYFCINSENGTQINVQTDFFIIVNLHHIFGLI